MQQEKLKIVFIPADNIEANISRSYYLAQGLANFSDLYYITWYDFRSTEWHGGKKTKLNTLNCFFSSLIQSFKIYKKNEEPFQRINASVFIDALVGRLLGRVFTKKLMRRYNLRTLCKIKKKIEPDIIFYADACYFFPSLKNNKTKQVADIQDDVDWNLLPLSLQNYEKTYKKKQFSNVNLFYIVSHSAKENFIKNIGEFPFEVLYNGADFTEIQKDYTQKIMEYKKRLNIENKIVLTHIGSATWVDPIFTKKLFNEIYTIDKSIVLILVGSMAKIDAPNIINIGMVSAEESYIYYNLTDIGILLKNSKNSDFLYNSVPLKIIQYAAAQKPVISFPIKWLETEKFNNTKIFNNYDAKNCFAAILDFSSNFKWSLKDTSQWNNYNWKVICKNLYQNINSTKSKQINAN